MYTCSTSKNKLNEKGMQWMTFDLFILTKATSRIWIWIEKWNTGLDFDLKKLNPFIFAVYAKTNTIWSFKIIKMKRVGLMAYPPTPF